jgi:SAM-dependent methyltransferase
MTGGVRNGTRHSLRVDEAEWDDLASANAIWAVCTNLDPGAPSQRPRFFESGRREIDGLMAGLAEAGVRAPEGPALDFGCGLGRLTRALTGHFPSVVGVDISQRMLTQAAELNADCERVTFTRNRDVGLPQFPDDHFAFVLSLIVLQHVSSKDAVAGYIRDFFRVAKPGAPVVFQVPSHVPLRVRAHPLRVLQRALRHLGPLRPPSLLRRLAAHSMTLRAVPEHEIVEVIASAGGTLALSYEDNRVGTPVVPSRLYIATAG